MYRLRVLPDGLSCRRVSDDAAEGRRGCGLDEGRDLEERSGISLRSYIEANKESAPTGIVGAGSVILRRFIFFPGLDESYLMCLSIDVDSMQLDGCNGECPVFCSLAIDIAGVSQYNDSVSSLGKRPPFPPGVAAGRGAGSIRAGDVACVERNTITCG